MDDGPRTKVRGYGRARCGACSRQSPAPAEIPVYAKEQSDRPEDPHAIPNTGEFADRRGLDLVVLQFLEELVKFARQQQPATAAFTQLAQVSSVGGHFGGF